MARATTIDDVVAQLQSLEASFKKDDGVRWFNRLYLDVTVSVRNYLRTGQLEAPPFLEDLDVYFGNAYLRAFAAAASHARVPAAWSPLFEARFDRRIAPLQFAVAGMNAHINHDLALEIVRTCEQLGMDPGEPQHVDYESINGVLKMVESRDKHWLLTGALEEIDHAVAPADDVAAIWSIERARDAAWIRAQVLWRLRGEPGLFQAYADVNERATELGGRAILLPLP
jgi:hypothetical protein